MKTKNLDLSDVTLTRRISNMPCELRVLKQGTQPRANKRTFGTEKVLQRLAPLATCDTFQVGFLTGILLVPCLKK